MKRWLWVFIAACVGWLLGSMCQLILHNFYLTPQHDIVCQPTTTG